MSDASYCLLTACRNESAFIGETIHSIIGQSLQPQVWLILDDGSTDGTADIIRQLSRGHDWIHLHQLEPRRERSFGAQYRAIMRGHEMIKNLSFDFIGALDADISFENADYYRNVIHEFNCNPKLGIAGGVICEKENGVFKERRANAAWSVAGGVQTFRREVFETIGGYVPLEYGGSDSLAMVMTRMKGWETRSLSQLRVLHHRPSSTADGLLRGGFQRGLMDAAFGYHPLFMILKCVRRLTFKPRVVGSMLSLAGYIFYKLKGGRPVIPTEALNYVRKTQMERVSRAIRLKGFGEI
jgi:glycosyltransferase involved in cell wall biosynthesis